MISITGRYGDSRCESTGIPWEKVIGIPITLQGMSIMAQRVRARRNELRWSQQELAKRVRCSQGAIADIEAERTLKPGNIVEIAFALGVSVNWLKGLTEDPTPDTLDSSSLVSTLDPADWAFLEDYRTLKERAPGIAAIRREQLRAEAEEFRRLRLVPEVSSAKSPDVQEEAIENQPEEPLRQS